MGAAVASAAVPTPAAPHPHSRLFAEHVDEVTVDHPPVGWRVHVRCADGATYAIGHILRTT